MEYYFRTTIILNRKRLSMKKKYFFIALATFLSLMHSSSYGSANQNAKNDIENYLKENSGRERVIQATLKAIQYGSAAALPSAIALAAVTGSITAPIAIVGFVSFTGGTIAALNATHDLDKETSKQTAEKIGLALGGGIACSLCIGAAIIKLIKDCRESK